MPSAPEDITDHAAVSQRSDVANVGSTEATLTGSAPYGNLLLPLPPSTGRACPARSSRMRPNALHGLNVLDHGIVGLLCDAPTKSHVYELATKSPTRECHGVGYSSVHALLCSFRLPGTDHPTPTRFPPRWHNLLRVWTVSMIRRTASVKFKARAVSKIYD